MITTAEIVTIMGCTEARAELWQPHLAKAMDVFDITSPLRVSAFLAQIGHESGRLIYVREIWNPAQCPWQAKYEGRADLGNNQPGDGARFKGRGLIQITGRANYRACGRVLDLPLEVSPELLEQPANAALSAAWFWATHGCNRLADVGNLRAITHTINGGFNGWDDRLALYEHAKTALSGEEQQA
jgi:putative chitinase